MTNHSNKRKELGNIGEEMALRYLENIGYKLITKNFRIRTGEIDIIMTDNETLVFVEVRTKTSDFFGSPEATINFKKRQKILNTARYFLHSHHNFQNRECRFDIIAIVMRKGKDANIKHITNAFLEGE